MTDTPATSSTPLRRGVFTSEFALSLAAIVAATVLLFLHKITAEQWSTMTGVSASAYTIGRSVVKGWSGKS